MCLPVLAAPPLVRDTVDAEAFSATLDAMARRPSWTLRGVLKQPSARPGLPRRFHTKINLNEYWGVLEKVVKADVSWSRPPDASVQDASMDVDNEVNDNLANERFEQAMDVGAGEQRSSTPSPSLEMNTKTEMQMGASPSRKDAAPPAAETRQIDIDHPPSPVIVEMQHVVPTTLSPRKVLARRERPRRRTLDAAPCGLPTEAAACGVLALSPVRRVPLGTINGMESRDQLRKSLSPLSLFADNLARRLARQH